MAEKTTITVSTTINAPIKKVWDYFTSPDHITQWNNASDDWHTPHAANDLRVGGTFNNRMAAKDGSAAFDFTGTYTTVKEPEYIEYVIADGRIVSVSFSAEGDTTNVKESFEAENVHSAEMQQAGWQAILDNFKKYTEGA